MRTASVSTFEGLESFFMLRICEMVWVNTCAGRLTCVLDLPATPYARTRSTGLCVSPIHRRRLAPPMQVERRIGDADTTEGLREVAEHAPRPGVVPLGQESHVVAQ